MKSVDTLSLAVESIRKQYELLREDIQLRIDEFRTLRTRGTDVQYFLELCYCILAAGASAKMAMKGQIVLANVVMSAKSFEEIERTLRGVHRFPRQRAMYIFSTREYLRRKYGFRLSELFDITGVNSHNARRARIAEDVSIRGVGLKEASHWLRNIGFLDYAIFDTYVMQELHRFKLFDTDQVPRNRSEYEEREQQFISLSRDLCMTPAELDLTLWSFRQNRILK